MAAMSMRRTLKNVVKHYSSTEVKVREATSNDPWGPSSTQMSEVAVLTYKSTTFSQVMQMLFKRMNDQGKNWRHVYKALMLLEYLVKNGSEKVATHCKENLQSIQLLKDFQFTEEGKDYGASVREKAKEIVTLLQDEERLRTERVKATKTRERLILGGTGSHSQDGTSGRTTPNGKSAEDLNSTLATGNASEAAAQRKLADADRPSSSTLKSNAGGDNLQAQANNQARAATTEQSEDFELQMALALSKQEHERELERQKTETMRLQLVLEASRRESSQATAASATCEANANVAQSLASTGAVVSSEHQDTPPAVSQALTQPQLQPQSQPQSNVDLFAANFDDPWAVPISGFAAFLSAAPRNREVAAVSAATPSSSASPAPSPKCNAASKNLSAAKALAGVQPISYPSNPWHTDERTSPVPEVEKPTESWADFGSDFCSPEPLDPFGDSFAALSMHTTPPPSAPSVPQAQTADDDIRPPDSDTFGFSLSKEDDDDEWVTVKHATSSSNLPPPPPPPAVAVAAADPFDMHPFDVHVPDRDLFRFDLTDNLFSIRDETTQPARTGFTTQFTESPPVGESLPDSKGLTTYDDLFFTDRELSANVRSPLSVVDSANPFADEPFVDVSAIDNVKESSSPSPAAGEPAQTNSSVAVAQADLVTNAASLGDQTAGGQYTISQVFPAFSWLTGQQNNMAVPMSLRMGVPMVNTNQFASVAYPTLHPRMMQTQPFGGGMQMPTPMAMTISAASASQMGAVPMSMPMSVPVGMNPLQLAMHPNAVRMPLHAVPVYSVPSTVMYPQISMAYATPTQSAVPPNYGVGIALVAQPVGPGAPSTTQGAPPTTQSAVPRT